MINLKLIARIDTLNMKETREQITSAGTILAQ
jgi:hypothetical protein